jgi:hypothetical protein
MNDREWTRGESLPQDFLHGKKLRGEEESIGTLARGWSGGGEGETEWGAKNRILEDYHAFLLSSYLAQFSSRQSDNA